jgi:protein-tyrosine-phosphatase
MFTRLVAKSRQIRLAVVFCLPFANAGAAPADVVPTAHAFISAAIAEFPTIPADRQLALRKLALFAQTKVKAGEPAQLTFICTHNSRRSHMAQIWAQTAAAWYGIKGLTAYSGGLEATAMNPRTVRALERAGLAITPETEGKNPIYSVKFSETLAPIKSFSKVYNAQGNPTANFAAAMTCSHADKNCPLVEGSTLRVSIPYEDPKAADDTPEESARYDATAHLIATEMFYLVSQIKP